MTRQAWTLSSPLESPKFAWLDKLADPLQTGMHRVYGVGTLGMRVKSLLNGTPFRHRVHPAIIILPLGAWSSAELLDVLDSLQPGRGYRQGADACVAAGIVTALPAISTGVADWVDTYDHHRRVGLAHALVNSVALGLYSGSLALRMGGKRRGTARILGGLGYGAVMFGGALGGELVYNLGVNIPHLLYPKPPVRYVDVLASDALPEGKLVTVEVERVPVLLLRRDGQVLAVEEWCPHAGGPLSEGKLDGRIIECPWHQSRFDLSDGRPVQGPASVALRTFDVREHNGRIEVCPSYEGQDWPPAPEPPRTEPTTA